MGGNIQRVVHAHPRMRLRNRPISVSGTTEGSTFMIMHPKLASVIGKKLCKNGLMPNRKKMIQLGTCGSFYHCKAG
jgi:hypothetical protein